MNTEHLLTKQIGTQISFRRGNFGLAVTSTTYTTDPYPHHPYPRVPFPAGACHVDEADIEVYICGVQSKECTTDRPLLDCSNPPRLLLPG